MGRKVEEVLHILNPWWEGESVETGIERPSYVGRILEAWKKRKMVILYGLRRVGKTTIMRQVIDKIPDKRKVLYVSMDAYGLWNESLLDLVSEFRKIQKISRRERIYLFIDEVMARKGFEGELKTLVDHENARIIAASSSSFMLKVRSPRLTGRYYPIEVGPLSFPEFVEFRGIKPKKSDIDMLRGVFEDYMRIGGMPEYVLTGDPLIPKTIVDDILLKDIASQQGVATDVLMDMFALLAERAGKLISYGKLARILGISKATVSKYMHLFRQAMLVYEMPVCGKPNERVLGARKMYIADHGLRNVFTGFRDRGAIFENIVFMRLKHLNPCYPKDRDIDFLVKGVMIDAKYGSELSESQKLAGAKKITENDLIHEVFGRDLLLTILGQQTF